MRKLDPEQELGQLVREARSEPVARIDWDRVEQGLMRRVRRTPRESAPVAFLARLWAPLAMAAVAAAAFVLWLRAPTSPASIEPAARAASEHAPPGVQDASMLASGARLTAAAQALTFSHAGRASWTLDPHASAVLVEVGERIVVRLERGKLLAHVVPSSVPESFVVEAAGARVAVRGTVFSVELLRSQIVVDVEEGVVAVGPRDGSGAHLLRANAHGEFSMDGAHGVIDGGAVDLRAGAGAPPSKAAAKAPVRASAPAPVANPEPIEAPVVLPLEPSISEIENGVAEIVTAVSSCFERHTPGGGGMRITVRTALSLHIEPSGKIAEAEFQPPLAPDVAACSTVALVELSFAPSLEGVEVTRWLELVR
jgi:hypothetical protein